MTGMPENPDVVERIRTRAAAELSERQLKIFDEIDFDAGAVTAVAGAGAGKTRTLSFLLARAACCSGVHAVRVLTMSRVAKDEACARFTALAASLELPHGEIDAGDFRTIHSFALKFAREEAEADQLAGVAVAAASVVKDALLRLIGDECAKRPPPTQEAGFDVVLANTRDVSEVVDLLYTVRTERLHACEPVVDASLGPTAARVLERLQSEFFGVDEATGMRSLDFDEMLVRFDDAEEVLARAGEVLFVDEAQDLSRRMVRILVRTVEAGACVVVLGDDSQGIFQFSGACDRTIAAFRIGVDRLEARMQQFELFQNYRSTNSIVKAAEALLPHADRKFRAGVVGNGRPGPPVEVCMMKSEFDEATAVAARLVELLSKAQVAPGDVFILRHKNWAYSELLPNRLREAAARAKVDAPFCIAGSDVSSTASGRALGVLRCVASSDSFAGEGDEVADAICLFLKSILGTRGAPPTALRAVRGVLESRCMRDAWEVFSSAREALILEFKRFDEEETKKAEAKAEAKARAQDAQSAASSARGGAAAAAAATHTPKRRKTDGGDSQKLKNFTLLVSTAARIVKACRATLAAVDDEKPLSSAELAAAAAPMGTLLVFNNVDSGLETPRHPMGAFVKIVLETVVKVDTRGDRAELNEIVSLFDVDLDDAWDGADAIAAPMATLAARVMDKNTSGKIVFSTIHKVKGKQRPVVFAVDVGAPYTRTSWPIRASLHRHHDTDCKNKAGFNVVCCARFGAEIEKVLDAQRAEKMRLQYVAASRAEQRLLLTCNTGRRAANAALSTMTQFRFGEWMEVI